MADHDRRAEPSELEQAEIAAVQSLKPAFDRPAAKKVAQMAKLADEPPLLALSGLVFAAGVIAPRSRLRRAGMRMATAHLIATGFKTFVKNRVDRTRPAQIDRGEYRMELGNSHAKELRSFPSGHAAGAFAVARAASREYPIGPAAGLTAGFLAVLQVVRRVHFPSDTVAGAALGLLAERIAHQILAPVLGRHGSPGNARAG